MRIRLWASATGLGACLICWGACAPTNAAPLSSASPASSQAQATSADATSTPGFGATAAPPDPQPSAGRLEITSYRSRLLNEQLPLLVYLPPGFESAAEPLPALYLLHGRGYDEWQWVDLGATRLATQAIRGGQWPAFAIVMPFQPEPLFSSSDGGPDSYEAELLEGLLPDVEGRYHLSGERGLGGISRGGVWALEIAFRHPEQFASVAVLSPTLNLNFARPRYDPLWIVEQGGPLPANIFLASGDRERDIQDAVQRLSQILEQRGVEHTLSIKPGGHAQELWTVLLEQALDFLIRSWAGV